MKGTYSGAGSRTVADLFDEYAKRVSDGKAGGQWDRTRFKAFKKNFPDLAAKLLTETNSHDWGVWRDARLTGTEKMRAVGAGTVIRPWPGFMQITRAYAPRQASRVSGCGGCSWSL